MKKILFIIFLTAFLAFSPAKPVFAIENPMLTTNNKFGVHILFPEEIGEAAKLVNSNGGDWGYVLIPIQSGDKDMVKWQKFMDRAKELHVIPILRLATEGDYFNTKVWREPTASDILDFANFLNSLQWPVKNRYIVVFNEVNRGDEWGGAIDPAAYADLLYYSSLVFKERSQDFFIISAGLDNAAPNRGNEYMNQYNFLKAMHAFLPDVFDNIDGIGSHSYPNPGFSQAPTNKSKSSVMSFSFEKELIKTFTAKDLPVFITETGWSKDKLDETTVANYYTEAFSSVWSDPSVIAVTPFLLRADSGPFVQFSILNQGTSGVIYEALASFPKLSGLPTLNIYSKNTPTEILGNKTTPEKEFSDKKTFADSSISLPESLKNFGKWLLKIQ